MEKKPTRSELKTNRGGLWYSGRPDRFCNGVLICHSLRFRINSVNIGCRVTNAQTHSLTALCAVMFCEKGLKNYLLSNCMYFT